VTARKKRGLAALSDDELAALAAAIEGKPLPKKPKGAGRPCKYGPRGADGLCPKKPKGAGRPCKYGPRGADGLCPKKPRKPREVEEAGVLQTKIPRGLTPSGKVSYTTPEKLITSTISNATSQAVANKVEELRKAYVKDPKAFTAGIVGVVRKHWLGALVVAAVTSAAIYVKKRQADFAAKWAEKQLSDTVSRLKRAATVDEAAAWTAQYFGWIIQKYQDAANIESKIPEVRNRAVDALAYLKTQGAP